MREGLDLNKENSEKRKSLPHALKCQGRYWEAAVQFEEDPGKPDLNAGRHKSRWRNYHGSLHLHGDETHTPEWRKKNRRGKLRQVFYSWATVIVKYACHLVNYIDKYYADRHPYHSVSLFRAAQKAHSLLFVAVQIDLKILPLGAGGHVNDTG